MYVLNVTAVKSNRLAEIRLYSTVLSLQSTIISPNFTEYGQKCFPLKDTDCAIHKQCSHDGPVLSNVFCLSHRDGKSAVD